MMLLGKRAAKRYADEQKQFRRAGSSGIGGTNGTIAKSSRKPRCRILSTATGAGF
jgi:hypothetical protein